VAVKMAAAVLHQAGGRALLISRGGRGINHPLGAFLRAAGCTASEAHSQASRVSEAVQEPQSLSVSDGKPSKPPRYPASFAVHA
jgi:hypothetical protein